MKHLNENDIFRFNCTPKVACFNACCRDLNQFLFPYDIIRLRLHFNISSATFLKQYTTSHTGPETGLPVVTLRPKNDVDQTCPFVSSRGCLVYNDRPASCRMYPLARAVSRHRETGQFREHFALIKEPHCRGHERSRFQTPKDLTPKKWMATQGLNEYNRVNDQMMALISLKNRVHPDPLDLITARMFYTACYDIDTFRERIRTDGWGKRLLPDIAYRHRLIEDDLSLLNFGLKWVQTKLMDK